MGSVLVLETDSGEYLPESNAILTFLAEGTSYLPSAGLPRAQVVRWLMFEQRYIQTSISRLRYWTLTDKLDQFAREVSTATALASRALDLLDSELSKRPFIAGDRYTIADMSIFAYAHVAADARFELSGRRNLVAWFDGSKASRASKARWCRTPAILIPARNCHSRSDTAYWDIPVLLPARTAHVIPFRPVGQRLDREEAQ